MLVAVHPDLETELESLANLGFAYERSMGTLFGLIDNFDVRITLIATKRGAILYLLSAGPATNVGRASAIGVAAARVANLSWAQPE